MKMNTFTLGAVAGIAIIGLAVPILAQVSSAAGTTGTHTRPVPSQQQVTDMATRDAGFLSNIDAFVTVEKSAVQTHEAALTAAAAITDATQRQAAVQKADADERAAIQAALTATPALKSAMMPFGGDRGPVSGGPKVGPGMMGSGPNTAALAAKLGMTEAELKAALASGKTIQQIATEKGVTLPAVKGKGGKRGGWMMGGSKGTTPTGSTSSAQ